MERERNSIIDREVLAGIKNGATRAARLRQVLSRTLEVAGIWSDAGIWCDADPAKEAEEATRRVRDIDRSLKRLRSRGLIRNNYPDWEVVPLPGWPGGQVGRGAR